jgi:hypothetical protein
MSMQNVGIALTGDDRQLLQILQQMEGHLKSLNTVAQKAMGGTATAAEEAARAFRQVEQAAGGSADAVAQAGRAMNNYTAMSRDARVEANLLRQANRQMAMQMTDVVTSLASGMPLWMVFIQQGGQIKDAYGGVGQALSGVAGYLRTLINPVTAVIAVLGAAAAAALYASSQFQELNRLVVLSGGAAGVTAGQLSVMADAIAQIGGTRGQAIEALTAMAGAAGVGADNMQRFGAAAVAMARAGGPAIEETAKKFVDLGNKPLETLIKLNEKENFLTDSVYRAVRALQEQGREAEAAKLAQEAYLATSAQRAAQLEEQLNGLQRAWRTVRDAAVGAWNAFAGMFAPTSLDQQIAEAERILRNLEENQRTARSDNRRLYQANIDRARKELESLRAQAAERDRAARQQQEQIDRARALAAWDAKQADYLSEQAKHEAKIAQIRKQAEAAGAATDARVATERDERIRIETERFQQAQARQQADDGAAMLQRLQLENLLLAEQIKLRRDLTEGEKARIRLNEEQRLGKVNMTDERNSEVRVAMIEGDRMRREIKTREDAEKDRKATDEAKRKAADEERKQRERRIADLQAEYDKQAQVVQGVEDETLAIMRGKEALDAEKDARELRRAAGMRDRAAIIESLGTQTEESTLMVRIAEQIEQEVAARQRLRKQQEDQAARKAALALAEEERKERERALADMDRELEAGDKQLQSLRDQILATDDSKAAVRDNTAARLENAAAMLEQHAAELEGVDLANTEIEKMRERAAQLREEAKLRRDLTRALDDKAVRDANARAAREAAAQWERTVDQVGQSLADALMSGGKSAGDALKRYFSTLVLQPIIKTIVDPVARSVLALLGFGGATGAATAGNAAAGGSAPGLLGSLGVSAAQMSAYGGLFTSAAQLAGTSWAGTGLAAMHSIGAPLGQGLAMGAGTVAGALGPIAIGQMLGRGISGGYSAIGGRSGSSAVNLGTGIGALFGPIGAGIGAAVGGLVNRAFGRKLVDTGVQGTFGGEQGFTGSQFEFLRGGWFRSDKTRTSALSGDLQSILGGGFNQLRDETVKMARDLGLASESVSAFTKDIKLSLKGLTQEQIQQKLSQELGLVADEMARLAGGAGTTADSLRQLYQQVMSERAQLETQLLQLQGDTAELRRREREAIHESNRALYDRINALRDEQAALAAATAAATSAAADALARQISASQSAANAARQAADAYAQAGSSLRQTIAALLGTGSPGASAASAYRTGLAAAQAGDATAMGNLGALASTYAESLRGTARTRAEANIGAARIAAELQGVAALSDTLGTQRSAQAALLDINTAALQVLQEDLQNGNLTVETLRQHTTLLQAINASLGSTGAIASAMQALDANVDGLLTFDELQRGLAGKASDDQIRALITRVDTNGDRQVSVQELAADQVRQQLSAVNDSTFNVGQRIVALTSELIAGFRGLDANVDGLLTFDELQRGLAGKASDDQIRALIALSDANSDAQVSLQELTAERVRAVVMGTANIVTAANNTTATTGSVAEATGGVIDEQSRAISFLASSDSTLARVLAKLSESDPTSLLLVDRITSGNTLVADRLSQVISAINQQTAAQQAEVKRQQDLQRAQADLQSAAAYLGSLQGNVQTAQATLAGTPATTSVRVGTRRDFLGFAKGGIYEERANPAFAAAQQAEADAQAALRAYEPQVNALRDLIRSLGGVPAFALGGLHSGGLRIVGERGPELEATGPARYWSAADTTAMLGNSQRREELLAAEIRALRAEVQGLRAEARVTAVAANKTQRLWERVTRDGESMQITDVTPTP